jgi:hypothetical protein
MSVMTLVLGMLCSPSLQFVRPITTPPYQLPRFAASAEYRHFFVKAWKSGWMRMDLVTPKEQESSLHQSMENSGGYCVIQRIMTTLPPLLFPKQHF